MRRLVRSLLALIFLGLVLSAAALWLGQRWLHSPTPGLQERTVFDIPRGATVRTVASALKSRGMLDLPLVWIVWARISDRAGALKAGEYELQPGQTPQQLLDLFASGQVLLHSITFIEGSTFADMSRLLGAHPAIRPESLGTEPSDIMSTLGSPGVHPEGQFFPDTYHFARGTTDLQLFASAHRRMKSELESAWRSRAPDLPLATPYEALILASIVEKETALVRERPLIAGVFVERLKRGMRLQTDPTVIYGMLANYDGNIRRADLLRDTPYNTYTRSGLPPTPIALPGLGSLQAAVQPEKTDLLFFVATGDPDGSHFFSATLAEHNAAVRRYLRKLRQRSNQ